MAEGEEIAARLRAAIEEGTALFDGVSEESTARRFTPDGWCAREVIGHLIDSACNNHRRFIINQDAPRLIIDPYDQQAWVQRSGYAMTPVLILVPTWRSYNEQVARVIERIPDPVLSSGRGPMTDYRFPYVSYRLSDAATLRDHIEDYVGHIHHHFRQIRALLGSP